jgi:hypothetical protein
MSKKHRIDLPDGLEGLVCADRKCTCHKILQYWQVLLIEEKHEEEVTRRRREDREHKFELIRSGIITYSILILFALAIFVSCKILLNPNAPTKAQELAMTFLGTSFGTGIGYLLGLNKRGKPPSTPE